MRSGTHMLAIAVGATVTALSLLGGLTGLLVVLVDRDRAMLAPVVILFSVLTIGVGLGLALGWAGWHGLQNRASRQLVLPAFWLLALLFLALLPLGELVRSSVAAPALLPPLHVIASLLPPLALVAAVARPLQRAGVVLTRRDMAWQLTYGALGATLLSAILEVAALLGSGGLGLALAALLPGGGERLQELGQTLSGATDLADLQPLLELLRSPYLLLAAGVLIVQLALFEEVTKSLGVVMTGLTRGRLGQAQAFALGLMAGVGFSLVEAVFNGAALLPATWAGAVLLRGGTAVIHGLATGLMGLGWHALLTARRRWVFLGFGASAIGIHAGWNLLSGMSALASLEPASEALGNAALALLPLSIVGALVATFWTIRWLTGAAAGYPRPSEPFLEERWR